MDKYSRAVQDRLASSLPEGSERDRAEACFKTNSRCFPEVSKCISANGVCGRRRFLKGAREACGPIATQEFKNNAAYCQTQCEATILGMKGSTLEMQRKVHGEEAAQVFETPKGRQPPDTIKSPEKIKEWGTCVTACQTSKALESEAYKDCFETFLLKAMSDCAIEKCRDNVMACKAKRCDPLAE
mmetsp:Transcript_1928/g.4378  ORF Transcript_1928/g.4378 Transcript_1928/m.4378 type:complete len:185 (+) Transcript_1928:277-831(+)|eukprot:CAMPEP_0171499130 /NCGR_PEP_ID=MMETSP0958-20121227/8263_1 /TAXON_ID=87120 /ORGANISM="Aurantiochytrium limacinum, Strain ATCCMYA-1381" /LENGTH=184 /DNA_ID=CAMNT_0012033663 /DNA_START=209 /DNA_END=763 /DNA_ORIENTATION=+